MDSSTGGQLSRCYSGAIQVLSPPSLACVLPKGSNFSQRALST